MLKEHSKWLVALNIHKATDTIGRKVPPERRHGIGSPTIAKWLNANGEVMSHTKISQLLKINDNLDRGLQEEVEKKQTTW